MGQKQIDKILELAQEFFQHRNGLKDFQRIAESAEGLQALSRSNNPGGVICQGLLLTSSHGLFTYFHRFPKVCYKKS